MTSIIQSSGYGIRSQNLVIGSVPPPASRDVWTGTQGLYLKINPAQVNWEAMFAMGYGANSRTAWDSRLSEIQEDDSFKGFQISVPWGIYEKGASGGDFSNLQYLYNVLDEIAAINRYVILQPFEFREFRNANVSGLPLIEQYRYALPTDMNSGSPPMRGLISTPQGIPVYREHYANDWAYAYIKNSVNPTSAFGYNLKLYKSALRTRLQTYITAIAEYRPNTGVPKIKDHPALIAISTTESVVGTPVYTGQYGFATSEGASARAMMDGKTAVLGACRSAFPDCMFMQDINYPNDNTNGGLQAIDYPGEWYGAFPAGRYSRTTSNSGNWWTPALNRVDAGTLGQGANRYMADSNGADPIFAQLQGDEFDSGTEGVSHLINNTADYTQRYEDLYTRVRAGDGGTKYGLNCHFIIMQREHPQGIWTGGTATGQPNVPNGTVVPSFKDWWIAKMLTLPGGQRSTGGLNTVRPTYVNMNI